MKIALFGTYDEQKHPRVQVLREGLARLDDGVDVVNVPLQFSTAARVQLVLQPWQGLLVGARLLVTWARLLVRSRRVRRPDAVVIGYLSHFDVHLARLRWRRAHLVLDYMVSLADTVRDRGIDRSRILVKIFQWIDRAALARADTVVVDTEEQAQQLPTPHREKAVVVPVGASQAWLDAGAARPTSAGPLRVIFFGLYTPLQGAPVIGEAIGKLAGHDIAWTMVGSGQERAATEAAVRLAHPHPIEVTWRDWAAPAELPGLVAQHDVCLGIFGTGAKAQRVVPNKVYQGAAVGCAIVTSDTPPQRAVLGDAAIYVPAGDASALATALADLASHRDELVRYQRLARTTAVSSFASTTVSRGLYNRLVSTKD